jgi:hypothetical protein
VLPALDRGGPSGGVRRRAGPASRPLMAGPACLPRPRLPRLFPARRAAFPQWLSGPGRRACYLGVCQPSRNGSS